MENIIYAIITFIYGIFIGSFLNVCIYRIPKKESVVVVRSHCMNCGKNIKWYDLVPIFSFLILGGKCRYCKTKLSAQYPLIEFLNGIGYAIIILIRGFNLVSILYCLCFSSLLALSVIDFRTFEIPFAFNVFIGILGIIRLLTDLKHWYVYIIGFVVVSGFLYLIFIITKGRGIGGGDVKLMAAAGLLLGWKGIVLSLGLGCILGSIIHIILMKVQKKDRVLAMGPYLSLGIFITMLWGDKIINWYLNSYIR
ncbi:leader peptidase (prepilin peptidase) / N-methyltransferase [Lachnospiraceae bacterium RM5]|nr:leader peptidase (prepilin peptidase) / N-methyltransferase [Lachnospiraceae bacterium RM5]